jgi:hypothetical protein
MFVTLASTNGIFHKLESVLTYFYLRFCQADTGSAVK